MDSIDGPISRGVPVKTKQASLVVNTLLVVTCCVFFGVAAQTPTVIPLASEPHHHLALHNDYVNVYQVEVAPHDSVLLHRHDVDAISVMMSDSDVTVHAPGKADVHQKLTDGQIRLQARGYVHSTSIDGDTRYRNVTVELLLPQQGWRNLCAPVIATQPLNCPAGQEAAGSAGHDEQPQFETEQTSVTLVRLPPHQRIGLSDLRGSELAIALDAGIAQAGGNGAEKSLHPGDFAWLDSGGTARVFKNDGDREARLVYFVLKPKR
jgi:quercetin dioxygenase-like cupin family protein